MHINLLIPKHQYAPRDALEVVTHFSFMPGHTATPEINVPALHLGPTGMAAVGRDPQYTYSAMP